MRITLDYIRKYIINNNIKIPIDISMPIKSLGILKIWRKNNDKNWIIRIAPLSSKLFKKGIFTVAIDFPDFYPINRPEAKIVNKIYHLNINPSNGHISAAFLNDWNPLTSITELLVGICLVFIYDQNPNSPYSNIMARQFKSDPYQFAEKVEEFIKKYASPTNEDLLLLSELKFNDIKESIIDKEISELNEKGKLLEEENFLKKQKLIKEEKYQNDFEKSKNDNNNSFNLKFFELIEEIKELKSKLPFNLDKNERLMTVIFTTFDNKLYYSVICKNTHIFNIIENMLYKEYPEYLESENYFTVNGKKINKYKTLEENEIKNSDIIILNKLDI